MNKFNTSPLALLVIVLASAAGGFAAGYFAREPRAAAPEENSNTNKTAPPVSVGDAPAVVGPSASPQALIIDYADSLARWKGPFNDQAEYLEVFQKRNAKKEEIIKMGAPVFQYIIQFLGEPGSVPNVVREGDNTKERRRIDPEIREALIELLPSLDPAAAAKDVAIRLLDTNESGRVRAKCAGLLAHLDKNIGTPALVDALDKASERPWDGARAIVESLQVIKGEQAEAALLQALQRPTTERGLRSATAQALGILNSQKAVPSLELIVRHEASDHYVRRDAIRSIVRIDKAKAIEIINDQILKEKDTEFFLPFLLDIQKTLAK